jgi:hypothetical protein
MEMDAMAQEIRAKKRGRKRAKDREKKLRVRCRDAART